MIWPFGKRETRETYTQGRINRSVADAEGRSGGYGRCYDRGSGRPVVARILRGRLGQPNRATTIHDRPAAIDAW